MGASGSPTRTVLVTGAAGFVASLMLPAFREAYALRLVDVKREDRDGRRVEGVILHDLHDPDLDLHRPLFRGVDAVVHLARFRPSSNLDYLEHRKNVDLAYHVYQVALEEGVRRVVMASSNHAADWYEPLVHAGEREIVLPEERPLARSFYGWGKATYEHMGFLYAQGALGRRLEVIQVRIGHPTDLATERFEDRPGQLKRNLGAYISGRDITQLFRRCIDTPDIENEHGVPFQIFYGRSNNTRAFWSIANARRVIGYAPEDDSEVTYAAMIDELLTGSAGRL
jgi:hypothetical protein